MQYSTQKTSQKHTRRWLILGLVVVILFLAGGGYWWHREHKVTVVTVPTNTGTAAKANPQVPGGTSTNPTTGASASKDEAGNTPGTAPSAGVSPTAPTGQFVSDHSPNLSGSPHPNTETSACATTPGVQCKITFTSGSVVKSLPAQQTDGNGNTLWSNWTLQSVGLTKGTWQVTAVAINGSKTASAQDVTPLVVAE